MPPFRVIYAPDKRFPVDQARDVFAKFYRTSQNRLFVKISIQIFSVRNIRRFLLPIVIAFNPFFRILCNNFVQSFFGKIRYLFFGVPGLFIDKIRPVFRVHAVLPVHGDPRVPGFAFPFTGLDVPFFLRRSKRKRRVIAPKSDRFVLCVQSFVVFFLQGLREYVPFRRREFRRPGIPRRVDTAHFINARVYRINRLAFLIRLIVHGHGLYRRELVRIPVRPGQRYVAVCFAVFHVPKLQRLHRPVDDYAILARRAARFAHAIEHILARLIVFRTGQVWGERNAARQFHIAIRAVALKADMPAVRVPVIPARNVVHI